MKIYTFQHYNNERKSWTQVFSHTKEKAKKRRKKFKKIDRTRIICHEIPTDAKSLCLIFKGLEEGLAL